MRTKRTAMCAGRPVLTLARGSARPAERIKPDARPELTGDAALVVLRKGADDMGTIIGRGLGGRWLFDLTIPVDLVTDPAVKLAVARLRYACEPYRAATEAPLPPPPRLRVVP
jgi:hypothetical protein